MFGNRGCAWLPENRVKNMIGEKEIIVGDSVLAIMKCLSLTNDDIYALLKEGGNVDFSKSQTKKIPKIYYVEGEKSTGLYNAMFSLDEERELAEIISVESNEINNCQINASNRSKSTLPLPHDDVIAILESNEFRILERAACEMEFYGITEEELFAFHKTAKIDIQNSEPRLSPNPFYIMQGKINQNDFAIKYIVGENRTRINRIVGSQETDCIGIE